MGDYSWVPGLIGGILKGANSFAGASKADQQMQDAYRELMANLQARMGDYDALGTAGYKDIQPVLQGPSALEGIPEDAAARQAQQESLASLSELANNGGLSLGDMKALNDIQANLNRNNMARQKGLANEFAARGQLGSGAQLAMALQGQSDAAMGANQRAESTAAQAQQRAMQAILEKGRTARGMASDDYARRAAAAQARDAIEARNAAARMSAQNANNALRGRAFDDALAKAQGKTSLTNSMNKAVFGRGSQSANTTLGQTSAINGIIDNGVAGWNKFSNNNTSSGGSSGTTDTQTDQDLQDEEDVEGGGDD